VNLVSPADARNGRFTELAIGRPVCWPIGRCEHRPLLQQSQAGRRLSPGLADQGREEAKHAAEDRRQAAPWLLGGLAPGLGASWLVPQMITFPRPSAFASWDFRTSAGRAFELATANLSLGPYVL
jgi:hypothetical protein